MLSGEVEAGMSLEAAREAGANVLAWGSFVTSIINFIILAFVIFMLVRYVNKIQAKMEKPAEEEAAGPSDTELLTEIRDLLKK